MKKDFRQIFACISVLFAIFLILLLYTILLAPHANGETYFVTVDRLNIREKPWRGAKVITRYDRGEDIELTGEFNGDWAQVICSTTQRSEVFCWVNATYLTKSLDFEPFEATNQTGGRVRIRSGPYEKSDIMSFLKNGKSVLVSTEINGFGYVKGKGWIDLSYLTY